MPRQSGVYGHHTSHEPNGSDALDLTKVNPSSSALPTLPNASYPNNILFTRTSDSTLWINLAGVWTQVGSGTGGSGTVTSVGLSMPATYTVTNSPVTGAGTLTAAYANQSAQTVLAGPASGAAAAPNYRTLRAADMDATITADWNGYLAWTEDTMVSGTNNVPLGGIINLGKIMTPWAFTINTIDVMLDAAGTGATALANCFIGLYDSAGTRQFVSADRSTDWASNGTTIHPVTVTGGYTVTAGSSIYVALLVGTQSTTTVSFRGLNLARTMLATANLSAAAYRIASGGGLTSQTSLPTSLTLANNTTTNVVAPWFGLR